MAIDPVTGLIMTATQKVANAQLNRDYDKHLKESMERHAEFVRIGNENTRAMAELATGGKEPLGWIYSGSIGSVKLYLTKEEYLQKFVRYYGSIVTDAELAGWNPAWGGPKTEIAMARREYYARLHPERAEQIRNAPLDTYAIEVRHWETPSERSLRIQREEEAKEKNGDRQLISMFKWTFIIGTLFFLIKWYSQWP